MFEQEISNKMKILVTYVGAYDIPAKDGQDAVKGCSVRYFFFGDHGEQLHPETEIDPAIAVGYQLNKASLEYKYRTVCNTVPGIYNADFRMATGGDGKPVLKLCDLNFIEPFDFSKAISKPDKAVTAANK